MSTLAFYFWTDPFFQLLTSPWLLYSEQLLIRPAHLCGEQLLTRPAHLYGEQLLTRPAYLCVQLEEQKKFLQKKVCHACIGTPNRVQALLETGKSGNKEMCHSE